MADSAPAAAPVASDAAPAAPNDAASATPVAEAPKQEIRKLKAELEGLGEVELAESDLIQLAQQAAKFTAKDRAAMKRLEDLERRIKDDPEGLMAELGLDPDKRAEARLSKKYQDLLDDAKLSPAEKELKSLKAEMAKKEAAEKSKAEREAAEKAEKEVAAHREHYTKLIDSALQETALPPTDATRRRMAQLLMRNEELGLEIPASMIAKLVEQEVTQEHTALFDKLEPAKMLERLGEKKFEAMLRVYAQQKKLAPPPAAKQDEKVVDLPKFITEKEFKKLNKSKMTDIYRKD